MTLPSPGRGVHSGKTGEIEPAARTIRTPNPVLEKLANLPERICGFRIMDELGAGGMGVVYLAEGSDTGERVALKLINPIASTTKNDLLRFMREAGILLQLHHPHIVSFRSLGEWQGKVYFAMDYVPGTDAAKLLKEAGGPLPVGRSVRLVCQLLEALEYAHTKRFVHRDIKPANVLIRKEGDSEKAVLADFGLARVYQASQISGLTWQGGIGGTSPFLAPEQILDFRNARPAANQHSTGAMLYTLLTYEFIYDFPPDVNEQFSMILGGTRFPFCLERQTSPPNWPPSSTVRWRESPRSGFRM